jgi:hypothetical protein
MAQAMTGRDSTPLYRSNRPISIFAKEKHVSTKTKTAVIETAQTTETPETPRPVNPIAGEAAPSLAELIAQRKQLAEQIKAAKAAATATKRAREHPPTQWVVNRLAARVRSYIRAGDIQDAALDKVLHQYRVAVIATLAQPATTENPTEA